MLKNEEQMIEIISFLVTQYRKAFNHGGDYEAIEEARGVYCGEVKKNNGLNKNELHILYLKGQIKADEEQFERHKKELVSNENELKEDDEELQVDPNLIQYWPTLFGNNDD